MELEEQLLEAARIINGLEGRLADAMAAVAAAEDATRSAEAAAAAAEANIADEVALRLRRSGSIREMWPAAASAEVAALEARLQVSPLCLHVVDRCMTR